MPQIIYILVIAFLIIYALYQYFYLTKVYYTNSALNQFRELQHEAVMYLSENVKGELSNEDVSTFRNLITVLSFSIEHLRQAKSMKFRMVKALVITIIACSNQIKTVKVDDNSKLSDFSKKYWKALRTSFRAVPFITTRLVVLFIKYASAILVILGIDSCKKFIVGLETVLNLKNDMTDHCRLG